jgi:hypothetical protein
MNEERLFELIEQVYAAAGTSEGWLTFLRNVRATFHGSTANLIRHDLHHRRGNMLVTSGADPDGRPRGPCTRTAPADRMRIPTTEAGEPGGQPVPAAGRMLQR